MCRLYSRRHSLQACTAYVGCVVQPELSLGQNFCSESLHSTAASLRRVLYLLYFAFVCTEKTYNSRQILQLSRATNWNYLYWTASTLLPLKVCAISRLLSKLSVAHIQSDYISTYQLTPPLFYLFNSFSISLFCSSSNFMSSGCFFFACEMAFSMTASARCRHASGIEVALPATESIVSSQHMYVLPLSSYAKGFSQAKVTAREVSSRKELRLTESL